MLSRFLLVLSLFGILGGCSLQDRDRPMVPRIGGDWWQVAGNPDLGALNGPPPGRPDDLQQPVDFAVWPAADGTWQLWSCIRHTSVGGATRLFYAWQGQSLTERHWRPVGIQWTGDPQYGEMVGGMQAPYVVRHEGTYYMFYGSWKHICLARSDDGKQFTRWLYPDGSVGMFSEGPGTITRDPMVMRIGDLWYCYYTAFVDNTGMVYCRTSRDLRDWSPSQIVAGGGLTGEGSGSSECPQVIFYRGYYYLLRTQHYSDPPTTGVYRSKDPLDFGINDDSRFIGLLPVAAPEIVCHQGRYYVAALMPDLQGIRIAPLRWDPDPPSDAGD